MTGEHIFLKNCRGDGFDLRAPRLWSAANNALLNTYILFIDKREYPDFDGFLCNHPTASDQINIAVSYSGGGLAPLLEIDNPPAGVYFIRKPCIFDVKPMTSKRAGRFMTGQRRVIPLQDTILEGRIMIRGGNEADIQTLQAVETLRECYMFASNVAMGNPNPPWLFGGARERCHFGSFLQNNYIWIPPFFDEMLEINNLELPRLTHSNMAGGYGDAELRFSAIWDDTRSYP